VFPQSFLKEFGIWNEKITLLNSIPVFYRNIKFPACSNCNSVFGSQFENEIISILKRPKRIPGWLFQHSDHMTMLGSTDSGSIDDRLALWLHKLLFGTLYYESTLIHYPQPGLQPRLDGLKKNILFQWLRRSFSSHEKHFLDSTLLAFRLNKNSYQFDYRTLNISGLRLSVSNFGNANIISNNGSSPVVALKIPGLLLIAVIADGGLVRLKFHREFHQRIRNLLSYSNNPGAYEIAIARALSMALNIRILPGRPKWIETEGHLSNNTMSTMAHPDRINHLESKFVSAVNSDFERIMKLWSEGGN
jgi:hypothetical protein